MLYHSKVSPQYVIQFENNQMKEMRIHHANKNKTAVDLHIRVMDSRFFHLIILKLNYVLQRYFRTMRALLKFLKMDEISTRKLRCVYGT